MAGPIGCLGSFRTDACDYLLIDVLKSVDPSDKQRLARLYLAIRPEVDRFIAPLSKHVQISASDCEIVTPGQPNVIGSYARTVTQSNYSWEWASDTNLARVMMETNQIGVVYIHFANPASVDLDSIAPRILKLRITENWAPHTDPAILPYNGIADIQYTNR